MRLGGVHRQDTRPAWKDLRCGGYLSSFCVFDREVVLLSDRGTEKRTRRDGGAVGSEWVKAWGLFAAGSQPTHGAGVIPLGAFEVTSCRLRSNYPRFW